MENGSSGPQTKKGVVLFFAALSIVLLTGITVLINSQDTEVSAPIVEDEEQSPDLAQLFNSDEFLRLIDESETNYALTQKDLGTFARTTGDYYRGNSNLIAFTFDKGFAQDGDSYQFTGNFYKLDGKILLTLTKFDKGIIKLSITNQATETNIDSNLNLNGVKNNLLTQLPIESDYYSVKYLYSDDKIIVAFYEGFSKSTVDEVVSLLQSAYGDSYDSSLFEFNINSVGLFTLDGVYRYLQNPVSP